MIRRLLAARFSRRLIVLMLLATIPVMHWSNWILSRRAADYLSAAATDKLVATADALAHGVDDWTGDVGRDLQLLSHDPDLVSMDPQRQRARLLQLHKIYPQITFSFTTGRDGMNVARADDKRPIDYHDLEWFRCVMAGAAIAREPLPKTRTTGRPGLYQAAPIVDPQGKILGAIALGMDLDALGDLVGAARYGRSGYSCLVDERGRALAHPDLKYAHSLRDLRDLPPVQGVVCGHDRRSYRFQDQEGAWWLAYTVPLPCGWSVASLQQEAEVFAAMHDVQLLALLLTGFAALMMTGLVWMVARRTVAPIRQMTATAVEIGNGDLTQRIAEERQDELGALAKAFNKMVGELESSYRRVEQRREQAETQVTKLSLAVEQSPASVIITDPQGVIEYVNPRFTTVTGYAAEEVIGQRSHILKSGFHPADFYRQMWDALNAGREWRGELCNQKKNGEQFWELTSISPIRNARSEITGFAAIKEDITERKRMEQQIASLAKFPDENPNPIARVDKEGKVLYGNHASRQLPEAWQCRVGESAPWYWRQHALDSLASGRPQQAECECGLRTFLLTFAPFVEAAYVNVYALDITDRKRAEAALQASEAKYRRLYESMRDACTTVTMDGRFVECNKAFEEMTGYAMDELRALTYADLTPQKWRTMEDEIVAQQVVRRGYSDIFEKEHRRKDGTIFPVEVRVLLLRDDAGKPCGMWAIVRNISDRKRAEDALRKKEEEFRQAQKLEAVGALAGGVAHEFNNLLQAIRAFTQFALQGIAPEEPRYQDLQQVLKASERAANLTRQLLGFSRRQQFRASQVRLNEILVDLEKMLRPLIGETIELQMELEESVGTLPIDPTMIQQVVMNLCINARDAMPAGGKLLVKTENVVLDAEDCAHHVQSRPGRYVRLTVSDTGEGIPPDVRERIFEPFFTTKEVGKGTGLGLSMVYGVVQQHGGTIRVRSEPGQGATFEIYLPTADKAPEPAAAAVSAPAAAGTETILMAEDDPLVRVAVVRTLTEAGYAVLSAGDGEEAVRMFAENSPAIALVLLDMVMPRMGGREAHRRIAEINPDTPVVYCSGYDSGLEKLDAAEMSRLCVLEKPVDHAILLATVRKALDRRTPCPSR